MSASLPIDLQGWNYLLGQRFNASFVLEFALKGGVREERKGVEIKKNTHTEPLTQEITAPLYLSLYVNKNPLINSLARRAHYFPHKRWCGEAEVHPFPFPLSLRVI